MDDDEEAYFNAADDVEEDEGLPTVVKQPLVNGASPVRPLVSYHDDDDGEDGPDILASSPDHEKELMKRKSGRLRRLPPGLRVASMARMILMTIISRRKWQNMKSEKGFAARILHRRLHRSKRLQKQML